MVNEGKTCTEENDKEKEKIERQVSCPETSDSVQHVHRSFQGRHRHKKGQVHHWRKEIEIHKVVKP